MKKRRLRACVCGYAAPNLNQMRIHRLSCDRWHTRDVQAVQAARVRETRLALGTMNPDNICSECGNTGRHKITCSHHQNKRAEILPPSAFKGLVRAMEKRGPLQDDPPPIVPPRRVVHSMPMPGRKQILVVLECGHTVKRTRVPQMVICHACEAHA